MILSIYLNDIVLGINKRELKIITNKDHSVSQVLFYVFFFKYWRRETKTSYQRCFEGHRQTSKMQSLKKEKKNFKAQYISDT